MTNAERKHRIAGEIWQERERQDRQWGGAEHDDSHAKAHWLCFISDQTTYAFDSIDNPVYRERLVKIAALAVAALESYDRKAESK